MLDELIEFLEVIEADDKFFATLARIMKKFHSALVKEGFTQKQATQIIASQGTGFSKKH